MVRVCLKARLKDKSCPMRWQFYQCLFFSDSPVHFLSKKCELVTFNPRTNGDAPPLAIDPFSLHEKLFAPCITMAASHRGQAASIAMITRKLLSSFIHGPQVQQRRETHQDLNKGGILLHCRKQEVQKHFSKC